MAWDLSDKTIIWSLLLLWLMVYIKGSNGRWRYGNAFMWLFLLYLFFWWVRCNLCVKMWPYTTWWIAEIFWVVYAPCINGIERNMNVWVPFRYSNSFLLTLQPNKIESCYLFPKSSFQTIYMKVFIYVTWWIIPSKNNNKRNIERNMLTLTYK